jgi:hypothetical protein
MGRRTVAVVALISLLPVAPAHDPFCGGEVTNHAAWWVRIANDWCPGGGDHLPCVAFTDDPGRFPADVWLGPNEFSSRYTGYADTDAFQAPSNCVTTVAVRIGPIRLGPWTYDRRGRDSLWVHVGNTQLVDVTAMRC